MSKYIKIALVGKPNVGKSTLVNRLCDHSEAIVHSRPMITRDRKQYKTDWSGINFIVTDTGGIDLFDKQDSLSKKIFQQAIKAVDEADIVIFLVDVKNPITILDYEIANLLRKTKKPIIFVGNKWDNPQDLSTSYYIEEYLDLGFGYPIVVSAIHGLNITELLDEIVKRIKNIKINIESKIHNEDKVKEEDNIPTISILGQPNVGKSTLFNNIINEERVIVDETEGTTRDSIDSIIKINGKTYKFFDTAGLKKDKIKEEELEFYSKIRTFRSIDNSDICLVIIDSTKQITNQDRRIVEKCLSKGKSVCILFNKIDLVSNDKLNNLIDELNSDLQHLNFIPFLKISALKQKNNEEIFKMIDYLLEERGKKISEHDLTNYFKDLESKSAIYIKNKKFKIKFVRQIKTSPPYFLVFCNMDVNKKNNVIKYIENNLREKYGFIGTPILIKFKY